jgi:WD40 repeat protein
VWDQGRGEWAWRRVAEETIGTDVSTAWLYAQGISDSRFIEQTGRLVMIHERQTRYRDHPVRTIEVLAAGTGDVLMEFPGDAYRIHPDGDPIAILRKGRISVRSMQDGRELGAFPGTDCSFSPTGKLLATWEKRNAAVWDLGTGRERFRSAPGSPMGFSPDGRRVLAVRRGAIIVKDALTGNDLLELPGPTGCFTFSPDGSLIVSADRDRAKIWVADRPEASPRPE